MPADLRTAVRIDVEGAGRFRGEMRRMGRSLDALDGSTRGAAGLSPRVRGNPRQAILTRVSGLPASRHFQTSERLTFVQSAAS